MAEPVMIPLRLTAEKTTLLMWVMAPTPLILKAVRATQSTITWEAVRLICPVVPEASPRGAAGTADLRAGQALEEAEDAAVPPAGLADHERDDPAGLHFRRGGDGPQPAPAPAAAVPGPLGGLDGALPGADGWAQGPL